MHVIVQLAFNINRLETRFGGAVTRDPNSLIYLPPPPFDDLVLSDNASEYDQFFDANDSGERDRETRNVP